MYGPALPRYAVPSDAKVVRPIWNYSQKGKGEFKAQKCMDKKQLVRIGTTIGNTYATCMEQHCLRLLIAITAYIGSIIFDGDVVNAHAHANARGAAIYIVVDEVFQEWYKLHLGVTPPLGSCVRIQKAMKGHPGAGTWWSEHFDKECAAPLHIIPAFTEPTIYRRADSVCEVPTFMIRQVDDNMVSEASSKDCMAFLDGIAAKVSFKISPEPTSLFHATDI
jgi:hypothetical protein